VNFQDMISQTMSGAARPTDELGGINPKQVGLGMMVASIDTIHTQGNLQSTGVNTDLAIQGEGFFIMQNGEQSFYTRAGAFGLDENGTMVNPANGMRLQGWQAETVGGVQIVRTSTDPGDLVIPVGSKDPAKFTENVFFASNLDKRATILPPGASDADIAANSWQIDKEIYDAFGNVHRLTMTVVKDPNSPDGVENQWEATVNIINDLDQEFDTNVQLGFGAAPAGNTFILNFNNDGSLQTVTDSTGNVTDTGSISIPLQFNVPGVDPGDVDIQNMNLNIGTIGSFESSITQSASSFSTKAIQQDGYGMGYLQSFQIDQSGTITGAYTNGSKRILGQVALASFTNPGGLEKVGETAFAVTNNSGEPRLDPANVAGKGKILAGSLEMSNVDLSNEFVDMIVTQRGFQANSKTIQTSDQMLQELMTLKR
jgi:flagellar hook protein FlgE